VNQKPKIGAKQPIEKAKLNIMGRSFDYLKYCCRLINLGLLKSEEAIRG